MKKGRVGEIEVNSYRKCFKCDHKINIQQWHKEDGTLVTIKNHFSEHDTQFGAKIGLPFPCYKRECDCGCKEPT